MEIKHTPDPIAEKNIEPKAIKPEARWFKRLKAHHLVLSLVAIAAIVGGVAQFIEDIKDIVEVSIEYLDIGEARKDREKTETLIQQADEIYFNSGNSKGAKPLYEKAAITGNIYAKASLAKLLFTGWAGTAKDKLRGRTLAEEILSALKDTASNEPRNAYILGIFYEFGIGVITSPNDAVNWYKISSSKGFAPAQHSLARAYANGHGEEKNPDTALELWLAAANQGHVDAMYNAAKSYRYGWTGNKSPRDAKMWLLRAIDSEDADAAYLLGDMYEDGELGAKNNKQAAEYYEIANARGSLHGKTSYARALFYGLGISKNKEEAVLLWRNAADNGNQIAQYYLSFRFRRGDVKTIPADDQKSTELLIQAADAGLAVAQAELASDYRLGVGTSNGLPDFEASRKWASLCADSNAQCMNNLAIIYEKGQGVGKNPDLAEEYYRKGVTLKNAFSAYRLSLLLLANHGEDDPLVNQERIKLISNSTKWDETSSSYWYQLGILHRTSLQGLIQNQSSASMAILKAAKLGGASAANDIGYRYYIGRGIDKNLDEAVRWYIVAARLGDRTSLSNLREISETENIESLTQEKLLEFQNEGLDYLGKTNNACILNKLANRYEKGNDALKDLGNANQFYLRAAEFGSSAGAYNFARMQLENIAPVPDFAQGLTFLKISSDRGWAESHLMYAKLYLQGIHVVKNTDEALLHFAKAKKLGADLADYKNITEFPQAWVDLYKPQPLTCKV